MKAVIGGIMIAALIVCVFVVTALTEGVGIAILGFAFVCALYLWARIGIKLLFDGIEDINSKRKK